EQRCRAVSLVVVGHGSGATFLQRQAGLGAVKRLDLALFVERQNNGVSWRIDPTTSRNLSTKRGSFESLNWRTRWGWRPWPRQIRWTELTLRPDAFAIKTPVQWVVSPGGSPSVRATTRSAASPSSGLIREGLGLSRSRPSNPSSKKRSCQRQTQVLASHDLVCAGPIGREENNLGSPHVLLRDIAIVDEIFKPTPIGQRNGDGFSCAHRADSHMPRIWGIPIRTQMLVLIY